MSKNIAKHCILFALQTKSKKPKKISLIFEEKWKFVRDLQILEVLNCLLCVIK